MELEAEFRRDGEIPELHKYHLHPRCFMAAWEFERASAGLGELAQLPRTRCQTHHTTDASGPTMGFDGLLFVLSAS